MYKVRLNCLTLQGWILLNMKESMLMAKRKERANISGRMEVLMKVNGKIME